MQSSSPSSRQPVPRGLARTGPVLLSYGFRPFFLAAGLWGVGAMALWVLALVYGWSVGGSLGATAWHGHEMLFGYSSAALAGFLLTAIPNWTGRLPVSGMPLLLLFAVWFAGRLVLIVPDMAGPVLSIVVDAAFLPLLLVICAREVIAGKKWKDLKVVGGLLALSAANIGFHYSNWTSGDIGLASRLAIAAYLMLIMIIGGRIIPSFTRNWLAKHGQTRFPTPYNHFDTGALVGGFLALAVWVWSPDGVLAGFTQAVAAGLHAYRLLRWRGWAAAGERLVLILHLAYGFVVLGFAANAAVGFGLMDAVAALHVLTVGAIGVMTLAVMTRATRGHTGLELHASGLTVVSYLAIIAAALARPMTAFWPDWWLEVASLSGALWIAAFALYCIEYAPPLLRKRKDLPYRRGQD